MAVRRALPPMAALTALLLLLPAASASPLDAIEVPLLGEDGPVQAFTSASELLSLLDNATLHPEIDALLRSVVNRTVEYLDDFDPDDNLTTMQEKSQAYFFDLKEIVDTGIVPRRICPGGFTTLVPPGRIDPHDHMPQIGTTSGEFSVPSVEGLIPGLQKIIYDVRGC